MTRSIAISLSADTVGALQGQGLALYVMKGVKYGFKGVPFTPSNAAAKTVGPATGGGAPLIWRIVSNYLAQTTVAWDAAVQAYISASQIAEQQRVVPGAASAVELGQTVNVSGTGELSVASGGGAGAVAIVNQGAQAWTCGLLQDAGAGPAPTCAFPLRGGAMEVLTPREVVLLMFAANLLPAGSAVTTAYSSALLVDAADGDRAVSFDIDQGWSANGATWARAVAPQADLGPLLLTTG